MVAAFLQFNSVTTLFVSMATYYGGKLQSDHIGVTGRFAYKSIRLHRGRFAYTTKVVSPTRSESIRLH